MKPRELPENWEIIDAERPDPGEASLSTDTPESFVHLAIAGDPFEMLNRIEKIARKMRKSFSKAIFWSTSQESNLRFYDNNGYTLVTEHPVEQGAHFLTIPTVRQLAAKIDTDIALYGLRESTQSLYLVTYGRGQPRLAWCDSTKPGPSYARLYRSDGTAEGRDPRQFARSQLNFGNSENRINRYAFVEHMLAPFQIRRVPPEPEKLPSIGMLQLNRDIIAINQKTY